MKKCIKLFAGLFAACLLLVAGPIQAAKAPKVDICHFDAAEGIFKPISVSGNALQPHLDNHGDQLPGVDPGTGMPILDEECSVVMAPPAVLARAYIDVDRSGDYNAMVDVDISQLVDTDGSGGPSVGDSVLLGQYPKTFDPCPLPTKACTDLGNYAPGPFPVTAISTFIPLRVVVSTAGANEYDWSANPDGESWVDRNAFNDLDIRSDVRTIFSESPDQISVGGAPRESAPSEPTNEITLSPSDDYFLAVDVGAMP